MSLVKQFLYSFVFLTKIPVPYLPKATEKEWGRITPYFVLVGFIIGLILYFFVELFISLNLSILFSSLLILLIWYLITGALHLDGLMDTFDGICCQDSEKKLIAMKDSRIGAFGAIAGIFVVLFKFVLISELLNQFFFIVLLSIPLARLAAVYSLSYFKSSSLLTKGIKKPHDFLINVLLFVIVFIFLKPKIFLILFVVACFFISLVIAHWLNNHFKGHSGDTYGALIELSEVVFLSLGVVFKSYF